MNNYLNSYFIVKTLAMSELKVRYKRNMLGFLWSLLNPILNICLISIVFSKIMQMPYKDFVLFLMPGIMAWNLFVNIINNCSNSIVQNERIIKNIAINKFIFPIVATTTVLVDFFLALTSLLFVCLILFYDKIHITVLFLPVSIIMTTLFAFSIGTIISIINVYLRDIGHVTNILLQIMFFMTPVIYDKTKLGIYENLAGVNPMLHYIDLFRDPIYKGVIPSYHTISISILWMIASFTISYIFFKKNHDTVIFKL